VYHFRKKVKTKVATLAKHIGNDLAGSINAERQYTIINFPGTHRLLASGNRQGRLDLEDSFLDSIVERVSNNGEQGRTIDADVVHSSVKFYTDHEYHRHIGSPKWHELFAPISMDPWVRTPRPRRRNAASTSTTAA
jgi:hypothetical protein